MAQVSPSELYEPMPPPPVYTEGSARSQNPYPLPIHHKQLAHRQSSPPQKLMARKTITMMVPEARSTSLGKTSPTNSKPNPTVLRWPFEESKAPPSFEPLDHLNTEKSSPALYTEEKKPWNRRLDGIDEDRCQSRPDDLVRSPSLRMIDKQSRSVSMPNFGDSVETETHQALQYHHQVIEDAQMRALNTRTSGRNMNASSFGTFSSDRLAYSPVRIDSNAPGLGSGFSSPLEGHSRTSSPTKTPSARVWGHSTVSRSPDARVSSVTDLSNTQYPQNVPVVTESLVNNGLRTAIGDHASLLSIRKTLDMYRANVKKAGDPAVQYEFAVFMVGAAQDESLQVENESDTSSQQSSGSIRVDLLKEAKQILHKLCDRSYPFAQYYLADGYASGLFNSGKPDLDRSFPLFLAASKHGHAEAMYRTALCYEWGWGCRVDAAKAVQFFQHAASKNHPGAMLRLGRACLTGDMGLGVRYREGVRWLKRGAESADFQYNQAPYDLASLHECGYGPDVFKDETYAAQLYNNAADLGHKEACFRMGEAYEFGRLTCPKDAALSIHFYTGAAEQGHAPAQMALCAWYMVGVEGVLDKDESEAYEWALKAAEQGLPKAQYTIGFFTEMGIGCRRDPLEANAWYLQAADQGDERARYRLAVIRVAATAVDSSSPTRRIASSPFTNTAADNDKKKRRFSIFK